MKLNRSSVQGGLLFWMAITMAGYYTYPEHTPKRYRQLMAKGKHANQVVVAMARELAGYMGAMAQHVPVTASSQDT